jgi:hypothetical protein
MCLALTKEPAVGNVRTVSCRICMHCAAHTHNLLAALSLLHRTVHSRNVALISHSVLLCCVTTPPFCSAHRPGIYRGPPVFMPAHCLADCLRRRSDQDPTSVFDLCYLPAAPPPALHDPNHQRCPSLLLTRREHRAHRLQFLGLPVARAHLSCLLCHRPALDV